MKISLYLFTIILIKSAFSVPLEPTKSNNPLQQSFSIIDIPASAPQDNEQGKVKESPAPVSSEPAPSSQLDDTIKPLKPDTELTEFLDEKEPKPFRPTILIIQRRPTFPFFTNPFNTRVSFPRPSIFGPSSSEEELDDDVKVGMPPLNRDEDPFESVMTRLHSQFSSLFDGLLTPSNRRRPVEKDQSSDESNSSEIFRPRPPMSRPSLFQPIFPSFNFPQFQFPKIPSSNFFPDVFKIQNDTDLTNSTTSETKTVDGHVVTVNKTQHVIRDKDNKTNGFFQFQVINVRPTPPTTTERATAPPKKEEDIDIPSPSKPVDYDQTKFEVEVSNPSSNEVLDNDNKESKEKKVSGIDDGLLE